MYHSAIPVRVVRTNELQRGLSQGPALRIWCAPYAPMNYNERSDDSFQHQVMVRSVRTNELQHAVDNCPPNRAPVCLVRTNELQLMISGKTSQKQKSMPHTHPRITTLHKPPKIAF